MQGDFQADFQGDFQGLEQDIWGGTNLVMPPMVPDDTVDWSQWMNLDAMDMGTGPEVLAYWASER